MFRQQFNEIHQKSESFLANIPLKEDQTVEKNFTTVLLSYLRTTKIYVVKFLRFSGESRTRFYQKLRKFSIKVRYTLIKVRKFFPKSLKISHKESQNLLVKIGFFPPKSNEHYQKSQKIFTKGLINLPKAG